MKTTDTLEHYSNLKKLAKSRKYQWNMGIQLRYRSSLRTSKHTKKKLKYYIRSMLGKNKTDMKVINKLFSGMQREDTNVCIGLTKSWRIDGRLAHYLFTREY